MRIISWNVNGFSSVARKRVLGDLVSKYSPDLLFLQELKCTEEQADTVTKQYLNILRGDYNEYVDGSVIPGRHGVAMFAKEELYDSITWYNNIDPKVDGQPEGRLQMFIINNTMFLHTYTVNSRADLSRLEQRKLYDDAILTLVADWKKNGYSDRVVVLGDLNVVPEPIDYHGPQLSPHTSGMTDSERASLQVLLKANGLVDAFRELNPDTIKYSYWSYRGYARENNKGWRIDLALVNEELLPNVTKCDILTDVMGSDHAPIILEIDNI